MMLQKCPFCKTEHPIIVRGHVKNPETEEPSLVEDRGYSFCNCKNIWYTDWSNIDFRVYDNLYFEKYDIEQTRKMFDYACEVHFPIFKEHNTDIKSFLDIGAIHDGILDNAKLEGWDTYGLDINETIKSNNHKRIFGNIENLEILQKAGKHDVIWMSHVMEHLKTPLKTLENLYDTLNNNGLLYIAMPDPYFINYYSVYEWGHWALREHHILWDLDSFIKEAQKIGFKCVYRNRNLMTAFICVRDFQVILKKT